MISVSTVILLAGSATPVSGLPEPLAAPAPPPVLSAPAFPFALAPADGDGFDFSYTYIEVGYSKTDIDDFDEETDNVYGRGSLGLFEFLHVFVDYRASSLDDVSDGINSGDIDGDTIGLGAGAHFTVRPRLDVLGEAEWLYADLSSDDFSNLDDTNNGWSAYAGGRWMPVEWGGGGLELLGGFRWIDLETMLSDDTVGAWEAGVRVHLLKFLSVGAKYSFLEDDEEFGFDVRASF